jgi:hypothetical protein
MYLGGPFAVLTGVVFFTAACGSNNGYCPGLCPVESTLPTMTIAVGGGDAIIASAEIVSGPCSRLLVHSAGEAGTPTGYASAEITYNGPSDIPPLCLVKLTSLYGDTTVVTASLTATSYQQPCCPYGSCCARTSAVTLHHRVVFDQAVQTISFPMSPEQKLDGGAEDAALDIAVATIDADVQDRAADMPENAVEDANLEAATGEITGPLADAEQVLDLANAF